MVNQPNTKINVKVANGPVANHDAKVVDALDAIKVRIIDAPSIEQLCRYIPEYVSATWADTPIENVPDINDIDTRRWMVNEVLHGRTFLPTAAETIGITMCIEGISIQDVTHLTRYRRGSFSAQSTGDRFMTDETYTMPANIKGSMFEERYKKLMTLSQNLYIDMVNSGISPLDARYVTPVARSTFYYARFAYSDVLALIRQRIDRNIQPMSDNVLAYKMYEELLKIYPSIYDVINIDAAPKFYLSTMNTEYCSNLYRPEEMHTKDMDNVPGPENFVYGYREWPESFKKAYDSVKLAQAKAKDLLTVKHSDQLVNA